MSFASKPAASGPSPIAGVASTLPVSASTTAIFLPSHTEKRRCAAVINRQTGGRVAGRPFRRDLLRCSVEADNLILALDVVVDVALAVRDRELRLAGQRNRRNDFLRVRIDHGGVTAAAVEGPHRLRDRLERDAIRIGAGGNAGHRLECPAIEDHDRIGARRR